MEFKEFNIKGNYKQEVREGYQLIDFSSTPDNTTRATYNFENDIITVASANETTVGQAFVRYDMTDIIKNNAGNTLKFDCENFDFSSGNSANVQLVVIYNDGTATKYITLLSSSSINTYAIPNDTSNISEVRFNLIANDVPSASGAYSITITKPMLYFGTEEKEYEAYGVAPSVGYPSEIEAVGEDGSINETVCNKNLFDINAETIKSENSLRNGDLTITGDEIFFKSTELVSGTIARQAWVIELLDISKDIHISAESIIRPYVTNAGLYYKFVDVKPAELENSVTELTNISTTANGQQVKITPTEKYLILVLQAQYSPNADENRTITINKLMVSYADGLDYTAHEEQTIAMPCQQPMISEEDFFDWENEKEVHGWAKKVFDGTESWRMPATNDENAVFVNLNNTVIYDFKYDDIAHLSTHFVWEAKKTGYNAALNSGIGIYTYNQDDNNKYVYFVVPLTIASSVTKWKAWLAEQAEAGTPLTNYYIATTPTELPFTEQQKTVAEQIKALHSYKNITHIFSTDNVSANVDVEYYKDLETIHNNIETRLSLLESEVQ